MSETDLPVGDAGERALLADAGGDGPPLVLLVTPFILARTYRPTVRRLGRFCRVITVQLPGSGGASPVEKPWTFEQYAGCVPRVLDGLGLERAAIMGHSNSGAFAMIAAATYPERVSHVVLADTVGGCADRSFATTFAWRLFDGLLEPRLDLFGGPHVLYNLARHRANFMSQAKMSTRDLSAYARRTTAPALLAWGARDHTMPLECARRLETLIPRSQLYVSAKGSHDWCIDTAGEFASAVERFLGGTGYQPVFLNSKHTGW